MSVSYRCEMDCFLALPDLFFINFLFWTAFFRWGFSIRLEAEISRISSNLDCSSPALLSSREQLNSEMFAKATRNPRNIQKVFKTGSTSSRNFHVRILAQNQRQGAQPYGKDATVTRRDIIRSCKVRVLSYSLFEYERTRTSSTR